MPLLTKDAIQAGLRKLPTMDLQVPELGGTVRIRTMSGFERDAFEASIVQGGKVRLDNLRAKLVALCLVDEQGTPMFNELDAQILGRGSCAVLDKIHDACKKHNHINQKDEEELVKNSGAGQSGDSGTGSPAISA